MTERGKKIRDAFFKKYGVYHPSQLPEVKAKIKEKRANGSYDNMVDNMKKTLQSKYGSESYNNIEKSKRTKLEKYGDENYNNREKMVETNLSKYGMKVSPNTLKCTKERSAFGSIGFKSKKFKNFLDVNGVKNVSQLKDVKKSLRDKKIHQMLTSIFDGSRLAGVVTPLFNKEEYTGSEYDKLYKFKCCTCGSEFCDNLYSGNIPRCLTCYPHNKFKSSIETEILEFFTSHNIEVKQHDRTILDGYEVDLYIPSLSLAIECDGVYWHSEIAGGKNKKYHLDKTQRCSQKNIQLLHIWDWEWRCKTNIVKSIFLSKIGKSRKIYARNCSIATISDFDKSSFLIDNHIQGDDKSSIKIGLFHENKLVSVMTFVKSRYDKKYEFELSRFCTLTGTNIIGGASKMFKFFIKNYNAKSVVTYSDKRLFSGNVYNNIGMTQLTDTPPGYHYFHKNNGTPLNRIHFQKHKLSKCLSIFDPNLSEWHNMQANGYDRIWDCGHFKFEYIR